MPRKRPETLLGRMNKLVKYIRNHIKLHRDEQGDDAIHHHTCEEMANVFDLWESDDEGHEYFPVWLSRVVEGEMKDLADLDPG